MLILIFALRVILRVVDRAYVDALDEEINFRVINLLWRMFNTITRFTYHNRL